MTEWYEKYKAQVEANAKKLVEPKDIDQHILWLKAAITEKHKVEDDKIFTFTADNKFGFSENYVNLLMQYAYNAGAKAIDEKSFELGHDAAMQEVAKKLGFNYDND